MIVQGPLNIINVPCKSLIHKHTQIRVAAMNVMQLLSHFQSGKFGPVKCLPDTFISRQMVEIRNRILRNYIKGGGQGSVDDNDFFSSTFKVWESKVSLLFWFLAQVPRYWQFLPLTIAWTLQPKYKKKKLVISQLLCLKSKN